MQEINEITELIISNLADEVIDPSDKAFAKKIGITISDLNTSMKVLRLYDIAEIEWTPRQRTLRRMKNFNRVHLAGGLMKYLALINLEQKADIPAIDMASKPTKEVFISYSWDSEEHNNKVIALCAHLRENGYHVDMDRKLSQEHTSLDFSKMMHQAITDYSKIIVVLSKGYKEKANDFRSGVGKEYQLIIKEIDENSQKYILVSFERISDEIYPLKFLSRDTVSLVNLSAFNSLYAKLNGEMILNFPPVGAVKPIVDKEKLISLQSLLTNDIPEVNFDGEFNFLQTKEDFEYFLTAFEYNLKQSVDPLCKIDFVFEKVLLRQIEKGCDKRMLAVIKLVLLRIDETKQDLIGLFKILVSNYIHYRLSNNKHAQAIVMQSLLFFMRQTGQFSEIYAYAYEVGLDFLALSDREMLQKEIFPAKEEKMFLAGTISDNLTKIEAYNNNLKPPVIHAVWLTEDEYKEFNENLVKDKDLGTSAEYIMRTFLGSHTFDANKALSSKVIYEKLIPKAIWQTYWMMKDGSLTEDKIKASLNIDNLYVGLG